MNATNNRTNHDFQILHFLIGSCHTVDGAYALLKDLEESQEMAVFQIKKQHLEHKKYLIKLERLLNSEDEIDNIDAEICKMEYEEHEALTKRCSAAGVKELEFIQYCLDKLEPYRKFSHLSNSDAFEATQRDEWKYEFIHRAENSLLTTGTLPTDQFGAMRQHPDFVSEILPTIDGIKQSLIENKPLDFLTLYPKESPMKLLLPSDFPSINPSMLLKNEG